ncbi:MAG: beta-Ala-His dipeptidase [Promethearchaeota archaeon]
MQNWEELGNPPEFWDYFLKISKIPRCTGNEDEIRKFIQAEAEKFGFSTEIDQVKNILIRIPSRAKNPEKEIKVILQCHMDMVCEKNQTYQHDFSRDPLKLKIIEIDNEKWLTAEGTTLGADNGVGIAYQLAIMKRIYNSKLDFGYLELSLLFTASEEPLGLGAKGIEKKFIKGKYLINLDSEEEDKFIIGAAGAIGYRVEVKIERTPLIQDKHIPLNIIVSGLKGGHSGADINKDRANALKLLIDILWKLNKEHKISLIKLQGGTYPTAIPRESQASFFIKIEEYDEIGKKISNITNQIKQFYVHTDPNIQISVHKLEDSSDYIPLANDIQNRLLDLLYILPSGLLNFHPKIKDLVHTSTNLSILQTKMDQIEILLTGRSLNECNLDNLDEKMKLYFKYSGLDQKMILIGRGPSWTPDFDSKVAKIAEQTYKELYNKNINIQAIHAGLECSVFKKYLPKLEMISIGPKIVDVHSPNERLKVNSVDKIWKFLITFIKKLN